MFIIECLPFSKGLNKESLSYFSSKFIEPGSLIKVTVRNKSVSALVTESREAMGAKSEIKSANFQLKKIGAVVSKPFLQKEFLEAVQSSADFFAATSGNLLPHLIPSFILENQSVLSIIKNKKTETQTEEKKTKNEVSILQSPDEERFIHFRSLIREEFAKKKSVFMCVPKNEDIRQTKEKLERGIEMFVFAFHNEMTKKELSKEWKKAYLSEHPVLIIATPRWLFLPRDDFGTYVIDRENESGWKTLSRPFLDLRLFAETLADKKNIRAVYGDSFLRTETLHRYKQGEISEFENVKWRLPTEIETTVVDMRKDTKNAGLISQEKEFKALSPQILNLIKENILKSSHMFIFASRKGLSAVTVCRDCGEQVKCNNCSSPMILYKTREGGVFKCHQCGETRDAAETCQKCGSWKLAAFGAGIEKIAEEIRKNFPEIKLFEIHKDVTETGTKAQAISESFYETRGSILLGTEMAFSYLPKKVTSSAIASFDSLFSIPDFRIREKIFRLILQTRNIAKENFLIQSRNPNDPTVEFAISGNLAEFYKKEIEDRRALNYPPFSIFIKITIRGTRGFAAKESEKLKNILADYNPAIFPSIHEKKGEQAAINFVIKLPKEKWPEFNSEEEGAEDKPDLLSLLKSLPPHFEVKVDPDNLL